jgi:hypothetical protein
VIGRRGAALTPPEIELDGADIDAMQAWDIGEVLRRTQDMLGEGGRPLVLVNGQPTPNAEVFSGFPPDALVRVEVLEARAGALYGATPGQRVVNLVLQPRFSSRDGRLVGSRPVQGGTSSLSGDGRRSGISGLNTHQIGLGVSRETSLRTAERARVPDDDPQSGRVTLRPAADLASATVNLTRRLQAWSIALTLNGQVQDSRSTARFGGDILESRLRSETVAASAGVGGDLAGWTVQASLNGRAVRSRETGPEGATGENRSLGLTTSVRRPVFDLPAGPLVVNLGTNLVRGRTLAERNEARTAGDFRADDVRASLALPLLKAGRAGPWRVLGDVPASFGAGVRRGSGGGGQIVSGGVFWAPRADVRLNADWSVASDGLSDQQRIEPQYYGAPQVVFDFRAGEAVAILPIRGGNPDLRTPHSERLSVTASFGPWSAWGWSGSVGFQRAVSADAIGAIPALTGEIEAAFPDRVRRDAEGRLISIDYRPLNFDSIVTESLNTGVNFSLPRREGDGARESTVLRVAVSHSFQLNNIVALHAGLPLSNRLRGDGGGVSRQGARITVDARRGRWGVNASARWTEGFRTRRLLGRDGADDLVTSDLAALDLRVSFQMVSSAARPDDAGRRQSAGLQINVDVDNLFDARRNARLGDGRTAPGYGPEVQDPMGRTVRLTLLRRF